MGLFKSSVSYWMDCGSLFFEELFYFIWVVKFVCVKLFILLPCSLLMSMQFKIISTVSLLILVSCVFSFLFFASFARVLSILLIFQGSRFCFIDFLHCFLFHLFMLPSLLFPFSAYLEFILLCFLLDSWGRNLLNWDFPSILM